MKKSVILTIHGHVQGVGFRYYVMQKAVSLNIKGFVRNQLNGIVYIEAEGEQGRLELFIQACQQGPSHAWVEKVEIQTCPVQSFESFERK